jgi:very-short-patch-repair endonuclease
VIDPPEVLALFRSQRGCAHLHQLLEWSSRPSVRRRHDRGAIIEVLPKVFRLASAPDTFECRAMAAQLQSRPEGYLSGFTAAALRGISGMSRQRVFVTVPRRLPSSGRPACHQRTPLPVWVDRSESNWHADDQVLMVDGFRLEEPHSMMFTIAAHTNDVRFERAAEDAWNRRLITPDGLRAYVEEYRRQGRSGVTRTLRWLDRVGLRKRPMQSGLELALLTALRAAGLAEPEKQYPLRLANGEVIHLDLAWPDRRLAVEPGHSLFHRGTLVTARDQTRDRACGELGWHVMRFDESALRNIPRCVGEILRTHRARAA